MKSLKSGVDEWLHLHWLIKFNNRLHEMTRNSKQTIKWKNQYFNKKFSVEFPHLHNFVQNIF